MRPYQRDAQEAILRERDLGVRSQMVVMATGLGKCIDPNTYVWSDGLRRFGDLWGAEYIAGPHRLDKINGWYDDGVNPGKKITTHAGISIDGTLAHRIWIRRDDGFEGWCRLEDVRIGDYVGLARGRAHFGLEELNPDDAYLLGLATADACLIKVGLNAHAFQLDAHPRVIEAVSSRSERWRTYSGARSDGGVRVAEKSAVPSAVRVQGRSMKEYIEGTFGIHWDYSHKRTVPKKIMHGTADTVRYFLRGLFDGDGTANPIPMLNTSSEVLGREVQLLLLGLGVFCGLRKNTSTAGLPSWMVIVYDIETFAREVGFTEYGLSKDRFFAENLAATRNPNHDVVPGMGTLLRSLGSKISAKWTASIFHTLRGYYNSSLRRPSYYQLRSWLEAAPECDEANELRRIVSEHRAWTPVTFIEDSSIRRIDCEVDRSHAFVGNGVVNHNTVVIATLPELLGLRDNDVTLVIAHRDELIEQTVEKMKFLNPNRKVGIEKAAKRATDDCQIIVATVQSLTGKRLEEFMRRFGGRIGLFVIDEAHHAAAPTYRAIVTAIRWRRDDAMIMGFTATPRRADKVGLGDIFQKIVYSMDTAEAVGAGYLVPVHAFMVHTQTSLDQVNSRAGDFVVGELADAVDNAERNRQIIDAYLERVPGRKALVFAASVAHARNLRDAFKESGIPALFASGDTPPEERAKVVADFRKGKASVLVNCGLYLEGFDVPSIETIINARPTKSQTLYTQITGRGLRPVDEIANVLSDAPDPELRRTLIRQSHKQFAVVLDIVDIARRHELITAPTLWGLPAQIDIEGRNVGEVSRLYDKLVGLDPKIAARVRTSSAIEQAVQELEAASLVRANLSTWQPIGDNHWRISLPPKRIARDRTGKLIPDFSQEFAKLVTEAKRINPNGDAEGFALRVLNVDKRSIREESATIDVRARGEVFVATVAVGDDPSRDLATGATLVDAIGKADARVATGDIYETVGRRPKRRGAASGGGQRRRRHRRTPVMRRRAS